MAQPFVRRNTQTEEALGPRPLTDICVDLLIRYSKFLGDVGWIETKHLRKICPHLIRAELESIEDLTLEGSGRDLSWYTWHCWLRIYNSQYGEPHPDDLLPLQGEPPSDYEPPKIRSLPADYRGMIQVREQAEADRRQAAASRLRAGYNTENHKRLAHGVEYTTKLPPPKRAKASSPGAVLQKQLAAYNASKTLGGKPAVKVMKDLGLGGKTGGSRSGTSSSGRGSSSGRQSSYNWKGKSTASQQAAQPSALACLVKKQPSAEAAAGRGNGSVTAAAGAKRPTGQANQLQQHRPSQQQRSSSKEAHAPGSLGSAGAKQPAARAAAAAAAAAAEESQARSASAKQRGNAAGLRLLDTPVSLRQLAAGARR